MVENRAKYNVMVWVKEVDSKKGYYTYFCDDAQIENGVLFIIDKGRIAAAFAPGYWLALETTQP